MNKNKIIFKIFCINIFLFFNYLGRHLSDKLICLLDRDALISSIKNNYIIKFSKISALIGCLLDVFTVVVGNGLTINGGAKNA